MLNVLSFSYIALRVAYNIVYVILQEDRRVAGMRSLLWLSSVIVTMTLWIQAGLKVMDGKVL